MYCVCHGKECEFIFTATVIEKYSLAIIFHGRHFIFWVFSPVSYMATIFFFLVQEEILFFIKARKLFFKLLHKKKLFKNSFLTPVPSRQSGIFMNPTLLRV